jgi:hypothetical protein
MKLAARNRLRTTLAALCTLLVSQWTVAAHACPLVAAPGSTIERAAAEQRLPSHADCCEEEEASTICLKHCAHEEQATAQSAALAAPPPATKSWQPERAAIGTDRLPLRCDLAQPQAPPLTILYCVSLT